MTPRDPERSSCDPSSA